MEVLTLGIIVGIICGVIVGSCIYCTFYYRKDVLISVLVGVFVSFLSFVICFGIASLRIQNNRFNAIDSKLELVVRKSDTKEELSERIEKLYEDNGLENVQVDIVEEKVEDGTYYEVNVNFRIFSKNKFIYMNTCDTYNIIKDNSNNEYVNIKANH